MVVMAAFAHFYFLSKIVEELALLENGILVDLGTNGIVWLTVCIVVNMADMPEANALCNVLSQAATHFCRDCTIANTDVGTDQDSILNLQVKARVDMELRRKIDEINRLSQKTAKCVLDVCDFKTLAQAHVLSFIARVFVLCWWFMETGHWLKHSQA